jgi:hypothetical protein
MESCQPIKRLKDKKKKKKKKERKKERKKKEAAEEDISNNPTKEIKEFYLTIRMS